MQSFFQASIINTFSGIFSMAAGFGSTVLIARFLGVEGTGLTAFALWLVFAGYALGDRGIPAAVLRYVGQKGTQKTSGRNLVRQLYARFLWPVLLLTSTVAAYGVVHRDNPQEGDTAFWLVTAILFLVYCHSQLATNADQGRGNYLSPARNVVIGCLIQLPAVALGAYFFGAVGAMLGHLVRHLPQSLAIFKYLKTGANPKTAVAPQILKYSRNAWISSVLGVLVRTRVEFVFIGMFFSLTEVGYFAAGMIFTSMILQLSLSMVAGLSARFARLKEEGEHQRMANTYQRALRWMALFLLPISFGGAAVIHEILPLVFGDDFRPAVPTAAVLIGLAISSCLATLPMSMMLAHERDRSVMHMNALAAAVLIVLDLTLIPFFGGIAAALIKGLVASASLVWALWYCQQRLGLSAGVGALVWLAASALACAAAAWLVLLEIPGFAGLLIALPAGALVYLVGIRLTGAMQPEDIDSLRTTLRRTLPDALAKPAVWMVSRLSARGT